MCCAIPPVMAYSGGTGTANGIDVVESVVGETPYCQSSPFSPQQYTLALPLSAQVVVSPTDSRRVAAASSSEGPVESLQPAMIANAIISDEAPVICFNFISGLWRSRRYIG